MANKPPSIDEYQKKYGATPTPRSTASADKAAREMRARRAAHAAKEKKNATKNSNGEFGNFLGGIGQGVNKFLGQKVAPPPIPRVPAPPAFNPAVIGNAGREFGNFLRDTNGMLWEGANNRANYLKDWYGKKDNSVVGTRDREGGGSWEDPTKGMDTVADATGLFGEGIADPRSFSEVLAEVRAMLSGMGVGGDVSYDPLRSQARAQWGDADARTLAMYNQLQNSIRGEAAGLNTAYDTGVANTNAATEFANTQNLESKAAMNAMTGQQAQALGIQEAVANDIGQGNLSAQDAMARTADTSARGQLATNQLESNRVGALDFNNDLVGAAGLAGAQQRSARLNELNRLLAGYDVSEQEANAAADNDLLQQTLGLAQYMHGNDTDIWKYRNDMERYAMAEGNEMTRFLAELGAGPGGGTNAYKVMPMPLNQAMKQAMADYNVTSLDDLDLNVKNAVLKKAEQYRNP